MKNFQLWECNIEKYQAKFQQNVDAISDKHVAWGGEDGHRSAGRRQLLEKQAGAAAQPTTTVVSSPFCTKLNRADMCHQKNHTVEPEFFF